MGRAHQRSPGQVSTLHQINLQGHSVLPGLVGMHNHLFYTASRHIDEATGRVPPPGIVLAVIPFSAPRLYLAAGVTTIRTAGSLVPYTDLNVKRQIDALLMPGPNFEVTGPYIQGPGAPFPQLPVITDPAAARKMVNFWASQGATSFKIYTHASRAVFSAAVQEAHRLGTRVTAHLCSIGYREAAALGIDNLEHGPIYTNSEFVPRKQPRPVPVGSGDRPILAVDGYERARGARAHRGADRA